MRKLFFFSVVALLFSSCGMLNQNNMFSTKRDYQYAPTPDSTSVTTEYKISPNDILSFTIYSNDGFKLIDLTTFNSGGRPQSVAGSSTENLYVVEADGMVKLPLLGRKKLTGLTIREAEQMLEESYAEFYVKPYIVAKVINRKVILFPGNTGDAQIIELQNNNTKLIDVIAMAGGISEDGKAKRVKLIREVSGKHDVYLIDLSTIDGVEDAHMVLQANDIIYIEPRKRVSRSLRNEIIPIVSLISTTVLTFTLISRLKK